jgi:hypothetical protein
MSSTPIANSKRGIGNLSDKIEVVKDVLERLDGGIDDLKKAGIYGQLDPRNVDEAARRMGLVNVSPWGNLQRVVQSLRAKWMDLSREFEEVKSDYDALYDLRKRVNNFRDVAAGALLGFEGDPLHELGHRASTGPAF